MTAHLLPRRRTLLTPLLLAGLSACASLFPEARAPQIYRVSPLLDDPPAGPILHTELSIDLPTTSQSLDTDRIALTQGETRFDYYADSVWTDRLPVLVQRLMAEAFQADGRIAMVDTSAYGPSPGYVLRTDIRRFEAQYRTPADLAPMVVIVLALQLSRGRSGRLVGQTLVSAQATASQNRLDAIVRAFDAAVDEALAKTVAWTLQTLTRHQRISLAS